MKKKFRFVLDYIMRKSKIFFPVFIFIAVAVTVVIALQLSGRNDDKVEELVSDVQVSESPEAVQLDYSEVPLVKNEVPEVFTLVATYYNAQALGDLETLQSICDILADEEYIRFEETARYLEAYPVLEVYTKPGYEEGSTIAYVYYKVVFAGREAELPGVKTLYICTDEQGKLYIKNDALSEEANEYIKSVSTQPDVVDLFNRVTVEYNDLMTAQPELLTYLNELNTELSKVIGVSLAQKIAEKEALSQEGEGENTEAPDQPEDVPPISEEPIILYVKATTTVNVRSSDSEKADKLGKATAGLKMQVVEQRANGWTKVLFENKEGFIKSEFLQIMENINDLPVIGSMKAKTTVNVRESANTSSSRLGVLTEGSDVEILSQEGDWSKIKYDGQIGYVKTEYLE